MPHSKKSSPGLTIICYLFSFLISVFAFVLVILSCSSFTALNENFYINRIKKSDYSFLVSCDITASFEKLALSANIPYSAISDAAAEGYVDHDIRQSITCAFGKDEYTVKLAGIYDDIMAYCNAYTEEKGIEMTETQVLALEKFAEKCSSVYMSNTTVPLVEIPGSISFSGRIWLPVFIIFLIFFSLGFCWLIWRLQKWKHRAFLHYIRAVLGSMLAGGALCGVLLYTKPYASLNLGTDQFNIFVGLCARDFLIYMLAFFIVAGVFLVTLFYGFYRISKRKAIRRR